MLSHPNLAGFGSPSQLKNPKSLAYSFLSHPLPLIWHNLPEIPKNNSFLFFKHISILPTSGPWHLTVPPPGPLFPLLPAYGHISNITYSERLVIVNAVTFSFPHSPNPLLLSFLPFSVCELS